MKTRAIARRPLSVDVEARSFTAVLTTEAPVRTWIPDPSGRLDQWQCPAWIEVDETLVIAGVDLSRVKGMPLVDTHDTSSIDHVLGVVDAVRAESVQAGDVLIPGIVIDARVMPSRAEIIPAIADGFLQQLSVGYVVHAYELEMREGQVPLARATHWTPLEASLVPVGADPHAVMRSARATSGYPLPTVSIRSASGFATEQKMNDMDFEELVTAAEEAIAAVAAAIDAIPDDAPAGTDEALVERARKLRKARAEGDMTPEEQAAADAAAAEAEKPADATEQAAVDQVRSLARGYGKDVSKLVDDLVSLGTRSAELKAAVRSAIVKRGLTSGDTAATPKPPAKAPDNSIDVRSIYAARAKR